MEMLGDVNEYDALDALKDRVSEISDALAEEDVVKHQYEERISQMEIMIQKLSEERDQALSIGKNFGVRAYVERKIADHPHRNKLRKFLNESKPDTKESVDKLVEAFTAANPVSDEYSRIRQGIEGSSGRSRALRMVEDVGGGGQESIVEDSVIGGVSVRELAKLAGVLR